MTIKRVDFGIPTADAEDIEIAFGGNSLRLSFKDWQESRRAIDFDDVLTFRWEDFDETGIRDAECYEVLDSAWLRRQAELRSVTPASYAHYKLYFNACGMLDIIARIRS